LKPFFVGTVRASKIHHYFQGNCMMLFCTFCGFHHAEHPSGACEPSVDSRRQSNWIRIRKKTEKGWHQEPFFCRCSHLNMKSSGKQTHCKLRAEVSYKQIII
jgi:hypothetical protein